MLLFTFNNDWLEFDFSRLYRSCTLIVEIDLDYKCTCRLSED